MGSRFKMEASHYESPFHATLAMVSVLFVFLKLTGCDGFQLRMEDQVMESQATDIHMDNQMDNQALSHPSSQPISPNTHQQSSSIPPLDLARAQTQDTMLSTRTTSSADSIRNHNVLAQDNLAIPPSVVSSNLAQENQLATNINNLSLATSNLSPRTSNLSPPTSNLNLATTPSPNAPSQATDFRLHNQILQNRFDLPPWYRSLQKTILQHTFPYAQLMTENCAICMTPKFSPTEFIPLGCGESEIFEGGHKFCKLCLTKWVI
jgi:hypothetical protein